MKFLRGFLPLPHHFRWHGFGAILLALGAITSRTEAAALTVRVLDTSGKSLPNAVVMLEPTAGKLPVAPMSGVEISQIKRQFSPQLSVVTMGTPVAFPNLDTVRHHVYSFSSAKQFELKLYSGVPAKPVVFDKPGIALIGCNIHDGMFAWVVVVDTPLYAMSGISGNARIASVPAGLYQLKVWHSGFLAGQEMHSVAVNMANADVDREVRLVLQGIGP